MLKASEHAVAHNTNVNLVGIRNAEINYFNSFFTNFGTQCALIAGFVLSSISQVPGIDAECALFWKYFYWITTAIAFITSMHVLLCTVFISVYGQGLALRGPVGSMVRAVDGMIIEQKQVVFTFVLTIITFTLSTVGTYWIMMETLGAILSTVITVIGMGFWYHYSLRIYNRFKWKKSKETTWADADDEDQPAFAKFIQEQEKGANSNNKTSSTSAGGKNGVNSNSNNNNKELEIGMAAASSDVKHSGYLTTKVNQDSLFMGQYKRVYIVISKSQLFYYADKKSFELTPEKMLKKRPTDLIGYMMEISSDAQPVITLTPGNPDDDKKMIEFKCDTMAEAAVWAEVFAKIVNKNNVNVNANVTQNKVDDSKSERGDTRSVFSGNGGRR